MQPKTSTQAHTTNPGNATNTTPSQFFRLTNSTIPSLLSQLPLQQLIQLIWIIGGYILLRPYLELGFRKLFATQHEGRHGSNITGVEVVAKTTSPKGGDWASSSGVVDGFEDGDSGSSEGVASGRTTAIVWGGAARKRRAVMVQAWEEEQARLAEEQDLDGIDSDLLED